MYFYRFVTEEVVFMEMSCIIIVASNLGYFSWKKLENTWQIQTRMHNKSMSQAWRNLHEQNNKAEANVRLPKNRKFFGCELNKLFILSMYIGP